ncbi:transcriptional regulator, ArsR family [Anaerosphaera aminiphila DSM 21120]|uniref:Transcriptional regulator, ArsR family n=1 Tax=Anaerosphaera aminiphila DSM 21120 TaxID=1120995 RepID=A0A1M5PTN9_9FIRM|nr:metalloregulator ArsR/SmtB family transcription factor [Anaerosphaera aminiphila]SHH04926.1 transcriptional regulator, ArsR family [Anaerosphaera aminiphila DSM 21120]
MDMKKDYDLLRERAELLKVLGHPVRLCIVRGLLNEGEKNVGDMQECLEIPQSTVSQHLAILKSAGIIDNSRQKTENYYHISSPLAKELIEVLFK